MTESMQEIFKKPLSIENLCEKFEYLLDHEMTQELFNLSCEYEISHCLLSQLILYHTNCKRVRDIYDKYIGDYRNMLYKNHEMVQLKDGLYCVTTSLYYEMLRNEYNDKKRYDMTLSDIMKLKHHNNEFIYKIDNIEQLKFLDNYEMFLRDVEKDL